MCGICGVIGRRDPDAVARMIDAMAHRGPDGHGRRDFETASIGMTRLAIQDVSPTGDQPMANDDGSIWIVYNGEVYNGPELRADLEAKQYRFRSTGDTEVVLKLYQEYGEDAFAKLRGIFALAIHDTRPGPGREVTVLARDAMGVKPLLWAERGGRLVFGSEIKTLLASGLVERRVDAAAVRSLLLRGSVYQPRTMLAGVAMLPPAHLMRIERGRRKVRRYWSFGRDRDAGLRGLAYEEQVERMRGLLNRTVADQLVSDVPVGAFLSGGVDSSTLVAAMSRHAGGRVKTFSVGFEDALAAFDETGLAGRFAEHLGSDHTRVVVRGDDVADRFDAIVTDLDQPSVDGLNTWLVSRAARQAVAVAISGTGGDDLFMGYPWHAGILAERPDGGAFLERYATLNASFHQTFADGDVGHLLAPGLRNAVREAPVNAIRVTDELPRAEPVDRMTVLTLRGYTANQLLRDIDVMSMAHSLEVRVPYLDTAMIDAALSLPVEARIAKPVPDDPMRNSYADSGIKRILVDAARPYLPDGFDRVPKRGFGIPLHRWLAGPLRPRALDLIDPARVAGAGVLDPQMTARVRQAFEAGKLNGWRTWLVMVLQRWLELEKVTA